MNDLLKSFKEVVKITCEIYYILTPDMITAMNRYGIHRYTLQHGRSIILGEKKPFWFFPSRITMEEELVDVITFYVPEKNHEHLLNALIEAGKLNHPGRGSIYSEKIDVFGRHAEESVNVIDDSILKKHFYALQSGLYNICCVVQRGEANALVRFAAELGVGLPVIRFGEGMGLREKLGLLRVTIPAEKEIINMVVNKSDGPQIMNLLIEAGKLDKPGKGFIYMYPLHLGMINTQVFRGIERHAASIEQIIAAIDQLYGSNSWRGKFITSKESSAHQTVSGKNIYDLTIYCTEGEIKSFVNDAMKCGAKGATLSRMMYIDDSGEDPDEGNLSGNSSREGAFITIPKENVAALFDELKKDHLFDDENEGIIELRPAPYTATYIDKTVGK